MGSDIGPTDLEHHVRQGCIYPALRGPSPVGGKPLIARFDDGQLSSDGGLRVLREVEQHLDVAGRLAACIADPRAPDRAVHGALPHLECSRVLTRCLT